MISSKFFERSRRCGFRAIDVWWFGLTTFISNLHCQLWRYFFHWWNPWTEPTMRDSNELRRTECKIIGSSPSGSLEMRCTFIPVWLDSLTTSSRLMPMGAALRIEFSTFKPRRRRIPARTRSEGLRRAGLDWHKEKSELSAKLVSLHSINPKRNAVTSVSISTDLAMSIYYRSPAQCPYLELSSARFGSVRLGSALLSSKTARRAESARLHVELSRASSNRRQLYLYLVSKLQFQLSNLGKN